jgi:hypothetical protein
MGKRSSATTLKPEMTDEELACLKSRVQMVRRKGEYIEIGTAAGGTLCFMLQCLADKPCSRFVVVDTMQYFEDQLKIVEKNLANHGLDAGKVDFRVMSSNAAFDRAKAGGERFDFILVDASHKIRHVMADLRWLSLVNIGGLACFHDYTPKFKGVCWPIDRFLGRNPQFSRVGLEGSLLCIRREEDSLRREVSWSDRLWALLWSPILQLDLSLQKRLKSKRDSCPA